MSKIGVNDFVRRQTVTSKFSHYNGTLTQVADLAEKHFDQALSGYRDGVLKVPVPCEGFFSGVVLVDKDTVLKAEFSSRQQNEASYIQVMAVGAPKMPAKHVELILYRRDVLAEDGDNSTDCEWELVSINARATVDPEPLTPMAMARNFLHLPGGTEATYTAEEFAKAIIYWSDKAMINA